MATALTVTSCPPWASGIPDADPAVTAWGSGALAHPPSCPVAGPCTHIHVVFQGLGGYQGGRLIVEVLVGWVEGVLLQEVIQEAVLDQVLPQGLLLDEGNPVAEQLQRGGGWQEEEESGEESARAVPRKPRKASPGEDEEGRPRRGVGDASLFGVLRQRG